MPDLDRELYELFKFLAAQIPEMATMFLGILIALVKWRQYPRPALFAFLGFGILLFVSIVSMVLVIWVPRYFNLNAEIFVVIIWGCRSVLLALAYVLLLCAIFSGRKPVVLVPFG